MDKFHLKFDWFDGSIVNGSFERIMFSLKIRVSLGSEVFEDHNSPV